MLLFLLIIYFISIQQNSPQSQTGFWALAVNDDILTIYANQTIFDKLRVAARHIKEYDIQSINPEKNENSHK